MFSLLWKINSNQLSKSVYVAESFSILSYKGISTSIDRNKNFKYEAEIEQQNLTKVNNFQQFGKGIRTLSTLISSKPLSERFIFSKDENHEFMQAFPVVVKDLIEYANRYDNFDAAKWYEKALQYNMTGGKKYRGLLTVLMYNSLLHKSQLTEENIKLAQYLGWCNEMLHSAVSVINDIIDGSITRNGQPCWHTLDDVGTIAINDAFSIENGLFYILKKYFEKEEFYTTLFELFHKAIFITALGETSNMQLSKENVTSFTMDKYTNIVANKTAYYSFYLPVASAMHLAGIKNPEIFKQTKRVLFEMALFFQIQDDYLDCYGNPEVIGNMGSDIQNNKCTWLSVVCLEKASEAQKEIMRECYGKKDSAKIAQVKQLYGELGLPNMYAACKEGTFEMIKTLIQQMPQDFPHNTFFTIWEKFSQRNL